MGALRILVADDHAVVRQGVVSLIASQPNWTVCAEADNGRVAVDRARELKPDIAILDIGMPVLNGLEATRQILRDRPQVKILIFTIADADRVVSAALDAGARGFLLKSDAARDVIAAVQALERDSTFFTARAADLVLGGYIRNAEATKVGGSILPTLTSREREVIQLLGEGNTTKVVASTLNMSFRTAETHRSNIMRKLNLHSASELVLYSLRNGITEVATAPD